MNFIAKFVGILRGERARIALTGVVLLFCMAPTPGDVGGCGQKPAELDPGVFFASKANVDCQRCGECGLTSQACIQACDLSLPLPTAFPERCVPLVHDGEVCLRALQYASCDDYGAYMSDARPSVPTECNFCPEPAP
ncbi:MAG: hypothetical protein ABW061_24260 [Polyangiaceae bacterium]